MSKRIPIKYEYNLSYKMSEDQIFKSLKDMEVLEGTLNVLNRELRKILEKTPEPIVGKITNMITLIIALNEEMAGIRQWTNGVIMEFFTAKCGTKWAKA